MYVPGTLLVWVAFALGAVSTIAYTVVVRNAGPSAATGVVARDFLPAGVTLPPGPRKVVMPLY